MNKQIIIQALKDAEVANKLPLFSSALGSCNGKTTRTQFLVRQNFLCVPEGNRQPCQLGCLQPLGCFVWVMNNSGGIKGWRI